MIVSTLISMRKAMGIIPADIADIGLANADRAQQGPLIFDHILEFIASQ